MLRSQHGWPDVKDMGAFQRGLHCITTGELLCGTGESRPRPGWVGCQRKRPRLRARPRVACFAAVLALTPPRYASRLPAALRTFLLGWLLPLEEDQVTMPLTAARSVRAASASCAPLEAALRRVAAARRGEASMAMNSFLGGGEEREGRGGGFRVL